MSDEDPGEGMGSAVEILMFQGGAGTAARAGEQLALLPTPAARADAAGSDDAAQRRGPGRPAGSRNKSTSEWVDFIAARYRSPLMFLAETYSRPVEQLAAELGTSREKAFALMVAAARDLAPYMHQKQPMAVQVTSTGIVQLVIEAGSPLGAEGEAEGFVIEGEILRTEENQ